MRPRSWHVAQPLYGAAVSTECEVAIFGGNVHIDRMWGDRTDAADLKILRFGWFTLPFTKMWKKLIDHHFEVIFS